MNPSTIDATVLDALKRHGAWAQSFNVQLLAPEIPPAEVTAALRRLARAGLAEAHPNGFQWRAAGAPETTP